MTISPPPTYTLSDCLAQEITIAAIDGRVVLLGQIVEQRRKGSAAYWSARADLMEMQQLAKDAREDLETMRKSVKS